MAIRTGRRNRRVRRLQLERLEARLPPAAQSFQFSASYTGVSDTGISALAPDTPQGAVASLGAQRSATGVEKQVLLKFENLFGSGAGQIPAGSTIVSASLSFWVGQAASSTSPINLHRMAIPWNAATATWNSFSGNGAPGIQFDNVEAAAAPDVAVTNPASDGYVIISGLAAVVQSWAVAGSNFGWVFSPGGQSSNWSMDSSESATTGHRPVLTVQFTPPTPQPAPGYQALAGTPPSAMLSSWFSWQSSLENLRLNRVPSSRTATYYFAQNGSDSTGTGDIDRPWKSLAKAQSVMDAASGDVRLRFRRGDTWVESSVLRIDKPNVTVDSYGSSGNPAPLFSRFAMTYAGGWSVEQQPGVWSRPEPTPIAWLRSSTDPNGAILHRAASINEMAGRAGSWYYDAATARLYYHAAVDPNLPNGRVEAVPNDGLAWSVLADNVRLQDMLIQGSGMTSSGTGAGLTVAPGAGGEFVGVNVAVTWAGGRGISVTGTSAIATLVGCSSGLLVNRGGNGLLNSGDVTPFDIDGGSGLNEIVMRDCVVVAGALPSSDWDARPGLRQGKFGVNEHTNGPAFPPSLSIALRTAYPDTGWQVAGGTNVFGPSVTQSADVRGYVVGEKPADGIDSAPGTGSGDRIYVNNVYTHLTSGRPAKLTTAAYPRGVFASWVVNTTVRWDVSNFVSPLAFSSQVWSWYRSNQKVDVQIENSRYEVVGSANVPFEFIASDIAVGLRFNIRNSILSASGFRSLSLGNALGSGRLTQNAYAMTPLPAGTLTVDPAGVALSSDPGANHVPAVGNDPLYGAGAVTTLNFDQSGAARSSGRNDIGPWTGADVNSANRNLRYWQLPGVGQPPSPDDPAWFTWEQRLESARLANVPLNRNTTYYFAQSGNDLTGDGSVTNPFRSMQWADGLVEHSYATHVDWTAKLQAPDVPEFEFSGRDFTIAFWGNLTNQFFSIVASRPGAMFVGFPDNQHFGVWTGVAGEYFIDRFWWPDVLPPGWNYYAAGYSASTHEFRLSINGSPFISKVTQDPGNGVAPFALFSEVFAVSANISDVGYWSTAPGGGGALTDAEIAAMYRGGLGRRYEEVPPALRQNLVSYWSLNEPTGTPVYADRTGFAPLPLTGFVSRVEGRFLGDIRLRFRGGDTWREAIGFDVGRSNVTIDSYGDGMAYFNRFVDSYTTGWQQVGDLTLWKRPVVDPVGWLRPAADPLGSIYKLNETSDDVARDAYSFFYDSEGSDPNSNGIPTLYINAGQGVDPNQVPGGFESAPFGGSWLVTSDNVRMENLRVHGAGLSPVGTHTSGYGLQVFHSLQGFAEFVGVNLEFFFTGYHAFGHISDQSSMTLIRCRAGLCTNVDGTGLTNSGDAIPYVSFAGSGGQEFLLADNEVTYGTLPSWDWNASPGMRHGFAGIYTHANPGAFSPSLAIALRTRYPDNPWQVDGGTNINGPIVNNLKDVRAYIVGEAPADGIDSQPGYGYSDRAYINNVYTHLTRLTPDSAAGLYYGPALGSWAINTTVRIDGSNWTPSQNGHAFYFAYIGVINVRLINCHFEVINNDGDGVSLIQPFLGNVGPGFLMQNTVFSVSGSKPGAVGPIGSGRLDHNAYYFQVPNPNGTNVALDSSPTILTARPRNVTPSFGSPLYRAGAVTTLGYDRFGRPRSSGNADIGPYSAAPLKAPIAVSLISTSANQVYPVAPTVTTTGPIDRISARFGVDADVARKTLQIVAPDGGIIEAVSVGYDFATFTATWVLSSPLTSGNYRVLLDTSYAASVTLIPQ